MSLNFREDHDINIKTYFIFLIFSNCLVFKKIKNNRDCLTSIVCFVFLSDLTVRKIQHSLKGRMSTILGDFNHYFAAFLKAPSALLVHLLVVNT